MFLALENKTFIFRNGHVTLKLFLKHFAEIFLFLMCLNNFSEFIVSDYIIDQTYLTRRFNYNVMLT